jgi:hypothetical protein
MQSRQPDRVHNKAQTCCAGPHVQPPALLLRLARFLIYTACAEVCPGKDCYGDEFIVQKASKCTMGEAVLKTGRDARCICLFTDFCFKCSKRGSHANPRSKAGSMAR